MSRFIKVKFGWINRELVASIDIEKREGSAAWKVCYYHGDFVRTTEHATREEAEAEANDVMGYAP